MIGTFCSLSLSLPLIRRCQKKLDSPRLRSIWDGNQKTRLILLFALRPILNRCPTFRTVWSRSWRTHNMLIASQRLNRLQRPAHIVIALRIKSEILYGYLISCLGIPTAVHNNLLSFQPDCTGRPRLLNFFEEIELACCYPVIFEFTLLFICCIQSHIEDKHKLFRRRSVLRLFQWTLGLNAHCLGLTAFWAIKKRGRGYQ